MKIFFPFNFDFDLNLKLESENIFKARNEIFRASTKSARGNFKQYNFSVILKPMLPNFATCFVRHVFTPSQREA